MKQTIVAVFGLTVGLFGLSDEALISIFTALGIAIAAVVKVIKDWFPSKKQESGTTVEAYYKRLADINDKLSTDNDLKDNRISELLGIAAQQQGELIFWKQRVQALGGAEELKRWEQRKGNTDGSK